MQYGVPVPAELRSEEQIRRELAAQREQLTAALADLRAGVDAKRRPAARAAKVAVAGLAALVAVKVGRSLTRR